MCFIIAKKIKKATKRTQIQMTLMYLFASPMFFKKLSLTTDIS